VDKKREDKLNIILGCIVLDNVVRESNKRTVFLYQLSDR
jgi:hypothetical protein